MADIVRAPRRPLSPAAPPRAPLAWLPDARWGTAETPLPPVMDDDDADPDDELLAETPPDVVAMLGFDPATDPDVMAMDANWNEEDHKRDDDGKFSKGGGAALHKAAEDLPEHTQAYFNAAKKVHTQVKNWLLAGKDPVTLAHSLQNQAGSLKHGALATYVNKLLAHVEQAHGLPKGALGKAAPLGKTITPPKASSASAAAPEPAPAKKPAPSMKEQTAEAKAIWAKAAAGYKPDDELDPVIPQPHPNSDGQKLVFEIAGGAWSKEDKVSAIKTVLAQESYQFPAGGFSQKYAHEVIQALGGSVDGPAAATPSPPPVAPAKPQWEPPEPVGEAGSHAGDLLRVTKGYNASHYKDPSEVHQAPQTKRVKKALSIMKAAVQVASVTDAAAKKAVPSLADKFWSALPADQRNAVKKYSGPYSGDINAVLRPNKASKDKEMIKYANLIDEAFEEDDAKLTEAIVLRRGEKVPDAEIQQWIDGLSSGLPVIYKKDGFISASAAERPAFDGNVWFHMACPKGTPALGVHTVSTHKNENEVMLRHGERFHIVSIEKVGTRHHVYMAVE